MLTTRPARSRTTISLGTQPSSPITQPWPEITPPEGWTNAARMPLARATGISSLSGCRATAVRSSGWYSAESDESWVSWRLPIS